MILIMQTPGGHAYHCFRKSLLYHFCVDISWVTFRDRLMSKFQGNFSGVIYLLRGLDSTMNKTAFWNILHKWAGKRRECLWNKLLFCFEIGYHIA